MDNDELVGGGPRLERQERVVGTDVSGRPLVASRVPELRPTALQDAFIYLSIGVLVCGTIAIAALELGAPLASPVVKVAVGIGGSLLAAVTVDAIVRIWRSVYAWLPVDRGRALARVVWAAVLVASLAATAAVMWLVLSA